MYFVGAMDMVGQTVCEYLDLYFFFKDWEMDIGISSEVIFLL